MKQMSIPSRIHWNKSQNIVNNSYENPSTNKLIKTNIYHTYQYMLSNKSKWINQTTNRNDNITNKTGTLLHNLPHLLILSCCTTPFNPLCRTQTSCNRNTFIGNTNQNDNACFIAPIDSGHHTNTPIDTISLPNNINWRFVCTDPYRALLHHTHHIIARSHLVRCSAIDFAPWIRSHRTQSALTSRLFVHWYLFEFGFGSRKFYFVHLCNTLSQYYSQVFFRWM